MSISLFVFLLLLLPRSCLLAISATCAREATTHVRVREEVPQELTQKAEVMALNCIASVSRALKTDVNFLDSVLNFMTNMPKSHIDGGSFKKFTTSSAQGGYFDSTMKAIEFIPRVMQSNLDSNKASIFMNRTDAEADGNAWYSNQKLYRDWHIKARGDGNYTFTQVQKGNRVSWQIVEEYYPVHYVQPLQGNEAAVGFDLGSSSVRLAAIKTAEQRFGRVVSGRIRLVQSLWEQYGFLMFVPLYNLKSQPLTFTHPKRYSGSNTSEFWASGLVLAVYVVEDILRSVFTDQSLGSLPSPAPEGSGVVTLIFQKLGYEDSSWQFLAGFTDSLNTSNTSAIEAFNIDWKMRESGLPIVANVAFCSKVAIDDVGSEWLVVVAFDFGCQSGQRLLKRGFPGKRLSQCVKCPAGIECSGQEGQDPVVEAGFWAATEKNGENMYSVYRCRNSKECLRGPVGNNCALNRHGIGCANCDHGSVPRGDDGTCEDCNISHIIPISVVVLGCVMILLANYRFLNFEFAKMTTDRTSMIVCLGQLPLVAQILSVFADIEIDWSEPTKSILRAVSIFSFEIEVLNFSCIIAEDKPVSTFAVKIMLLPAIAFFVFLALQVAARIRREAMDWNTVRNTIGIIFFVSFMATTLVSVLPFQCVESPNKISTMQSNPSVLCTVNLNYICMVAIGVFGLLAFSMSFFSYIVYAVWQYPRMLVSKHSWLIMRKYRFVFYRFSTERYYYSIVILSRGLIIALMPIIFANFKTRQILGIIVVLLSFGGLQTWLKPWRTQLPNLMDSCVSACLVFLLAGGGMLLGTEKSEKDLIVSDSQAFCAMVMIVFLLIVVVIFGCRVYRCLWPQQRFVAFLSHHKAGCSAAARLIKMELSAQISGKIFLDADELQNLEDLLNIVRCMSKTFVLLLTGETLWRPWCAGEITVAFLNEVPIVINAYDEYVEPTDDELTVINLSTKFAIDTWAMISAQGVSYDSVLKAYRAIKEMPKIHTKRIGFNNRMRLTHVSNIAAREVAKFCEVASFCHPNISKSISESADSPDLVIVGDNTNGEAVSFTLLLDRMINKLMQKYTAVLFDAEDLKILTQPQCVVVALTAGALTSDPFARMFIALRQTWLTVVVTVRAHGFSFPTNTTLEQSIYMQIARSTGQPLITVRDAYNPLVSVLALPLGPGGNINVLNAEALAVISKIQQQNERCLKLSPSFQHVLPLREHTWIDDSLLVHL